MERMRESVKATCKGIEGKLADLLLDPASAPARVKTHVSACAKCQAELDELRATMALLDTWEGPEPSTYFLTRLEAQMRDERQAAPMGWYARLRARIAYGPDMHLRPLAAMALTVALLVGGGTYLGVTDWNHAANPSAEAAVVSDLQNLDNNAQLLDQLETISDSNDDGD